MRIDRLIALPVLALALAAGPAMAQKGVSPSTIIVGGAPMVSDRDIMENLTRSSVHQTFVGLLQLSGLAESLRQHGPFTVFAPTDAAFAAMPPADLAALRRPDDKAALIQLLQSHIVPGDYSSARLRSMMRSNKGQAELDDLAEGKLTVTTNGPSNLVIRDARGAMTDIILYDVKQSNGVVFVTDRVLAPG
jgi:uncharacterized surface protein with fasciclin (FAS1) repeats